ncbi:MAG: plasmid mobilization protein [Candidatus Woesearchaeota archaeon]
MQRKSKIDVYLSKEHKKEITKRANKLGLSVSDYMKLKALDLLKEVEK